MLINKTRHLLDSQFATAQLTCLPGNH